MAAITDLKVKLDTVEQESKALIGQFQNTSNDVIDSLDDSIADIISTREFDDAYNLIEKWENDIDLNSGEIRYLERKKLEIALAEGSDESIKLKLAYFEGREDLDAIELLLLSTAYYQVRMYRDAEIRIIQTLDIDEYSIRAEARSLARVIAGQTGNKQLVDRVMR